MSVHHINIRYGTVYNGAQATKLYFPSPENTILGYPILDSLTEGFEIIIVDYKGLLHKVNLYKLSGNILDSL